MTLSLRENSIFVSMNMGDENTNTFEGPYGGTGTFHRFRHILGGTTIPETEIYLSDDDSNMVGEVKKIPAYGMFREDVVSSIPFKKSQLDHYELTMSTKGSTVDDMDLEAGNSSSFETIKLKEVVDGSLILALERTLFAALNNAWLLAIGGVGLMAIGDQDKTANQTGVAILSLSIVTAFYAFVIHNVRVQQLRKGKNFSYLHSVLWGSIIAVFTLLTLGLELYNGILHPYLKRAATVELSANENVFN